MPITTKEISKDKKCLCGKPAVICWQNPLSKKKYNVCPECLDIKETSELIAFDESNDFEDDYYPAYQKSEEEE